MHPEVNLSSGELSGKPSLLEYKTETAPSQQTAPSDYQANELLLHSQVYNNSEITSCEGIELAESPCKTFTESVMSPTSEDCTVANDTIVFETPEKGETLRTFYLEFVRFPRLEVSLQLSNTWQSSSQVLK